MSRVLLILLVAANCLTAAYLESGAELPVGTVQMLLSKLETGREPGRVEKQLGPTNILPRPDLISAAKSLPKP